MKKLLLILALCIILIKNSFSQLPNQGTYLLKNLDVPGRSYSSCWGYNAPNGREYAILGFNNGTAFIDITDSANIREVDVVPGLTSAWREMKTYDHYAYIVSEATNSRLQIVDLQYLPDSVRLVTVWNYPGYTHTHTISQSGHYLYLNGGNVTTGGVSSGGVAVIDITNPTSPVKKGQWSSRYVHDCRVLGDTIWAANIVDGKITVINATNKDSLSEITNWDNLPYPSPHNCAITTDRKYILVTDENMGPGKLKVWNIQDLSNITFVTSWQPTDITNTIVHNVEIYGDYAVIAHYAAGIRIVNISNPATPFEVAWYDTSPTIDTNYYYGCGGVYKFPSGKIIGSDGENGLFVIKTTFPLIGITNTTVEQPENYSLGQNYPNPFNPVTKINYELRLTNYVSLKIYDILGNEVFVLVNEKQNAGSYEIDFDGSNFSSGVYFYKLQTNDFSETKKMTLLK